MGVDSGRDSNPGRHRSLASRVEDGHPPPSGNRRYRAERAERTHRGHNRKKQYSVRTADARKPAASTPGHTTADSDDRTVADMLQAIKVTTYHDKEFWLTLPDGSLIHLGRDTRIVYPERFDIDSRDVYLEGEAYFIIARNPACRFVVHTPVATTTVYGTEFNVSARSDTLCSVVLVKGSVGVTSWSGNEQMRVLQNSSD